MGQTITFSTVAENTAPVAHAAHILSATKSEYGESPQVTKT